MNIEHGESYEEELARTDSFDCPWWAMLLVGIVLAITWPLRFLRP